MITIYLYEMHFHTSETSRCANVCAQQGIESLMHAGYSGVCVTDHFHLEWLEDCGDMPYEEKIHVWLAGYRSAKRLEDERFDVLLGMELRLPDSHNEFLVYGLTDSLLIQTPELTHFTPEQLKQFADKNALFIAQAHPFRRFMTPLHPRLLHGIEIYNGNLRHESRNDLAREYAVEHGLTGIAGSDYHETEDIGRGGVWFNSRHHTSASLAQALLAEDFHSVMVSD